MSVNPHGFEELDRLMSKEMPAMPSLEGQNVVVTGGSRGLGLGIVEALVARKARVTVVARDQAGLDAVKKKHGVAVIKGDITDEALANNVLREVRPAALVLNAGAKPGLGMMHEQTWEEFSTNWNTDVKAGFHWVQAALKLPLPRGSRILIGSSGAAVQGSPASGGYAGSKRTLWFMAHYANVAAKDLDLGIHFQALLPLQMIGATELGRAGAELYAKRRGVSVEKFLEGFGTPMPPSKVGEHVVSILSDPQYAAGVAFGLKGDKGIFSLDTPPS